jgi:hypothetical protein|tara:strand:+ start:752 stop:940 length:189 start_codon:yes stop_codon:yes gene_type:complete
MIGGQTAQKILVELTRINNNLEKILALQYTTNRFTDAIVNKLKADTTFIKTTKEKELEPIQE